MQVRNTSFHIIGFVLLSTVVSGCAITGRQPADRQSTDASMTSSQFDNSNSEPIDSITKKSPLDSSSIRTVAYQQDDLLSAPDDFTPPEPEISMAAEASDGLTLEHLEQLALQNNPAIQQANATAGKAAGIRTQVGLKPNPRVGYFGEEIGNENAGGLHGAFVSQTIVRGNKLAWNRTVLGHDVQFTRWLAEVQRVRVRNDIRIQFYEALGAQKRLEIARQFRGVAETGVEISEQLLRVKEGARPDVLQSQVQLSEAELAIQSAEYEFTAAWNALVAITGLPELAPTTLVGDLDSNITDRDLETAYSLMVTESPLLAAACARVRRAQANLQRQRVQPIPNVNAQLGVGHDNATGDEFANVQLSLPLPVHNWNQGNIRAAQAEYRAATQNVNRIKMRLRLDLAMAMRSFQVAQATVRKYHTAILPKVGETLELMQRAQEAGEFNFLRVLTARRAYFDANLEYVIALTDLAKADTAIEGLLLTGGLDQVVEYDANDELRGAALSGQ